MNIKQTNETYASQTPFTTSAYNKITACGLWITGLGIFIQAASGAAGYPKIPPGIIILAATGLIVYFTARFAWASIIGILLGVFISIGVFTTTGTAIRLNHPADVGPFSGTLVQLLGLIMTVIAGLIATVKNYQKHP